MNTKNVNIECRQLKWRHLHGRWGPSKAGWDSNTWKNKSIPCDCFDGPRWLHYRLTSIHSCALRWVKCHRWHIGHTGSDKCTVNWMTLRLSYYTTSYIVHFTLVRLHRQIQYVAALFSCRLCEWNRRIQSAIFTCEEWLSHRCSFSSYTKRKPQKRNQKLKYKTREKRLICFCFWIRLSAENTLRKSCFRCGK